MNLVRTQDWDSIHPGGMNGGFFEFLHLRQPAVFSMHPRLFSTESFLVLPLPQLKNKHTLVDLSSLTSFGVFGFNFFHYSFCNLFFHRVTITPTHLYPHLHYRFHYFSTITPMIAVHIILDGYVRDYKTSTHNLVVEGSDNEVLSCIGTFIDCTYRLLHMYPRYRM